MNIYKKLTDLISKIAEVIVMLMIASLVIVIVAELVNRNVFDHSFRPTIEICGIAFLWMAFIGIIPLYHSTSLMNLGFISERVKGPVAAVLYLVNKFASFALGVTMIIAFVIQYPYVSTRYYSTISWLPYTIQYIPMMIAGAYIAFHTVYQVILHFTSKNSEVEGGAAQ